MFELIFSIVEIPSNDGGLLYVAAKAGTLVVSDIKDASVALIIFILD
ncbi:hypothetical protein NSA27_00870 [Clostridium tepidum]|nr:MULTISPECIES: hypothetical protein [Clostridium]MCR1933254.1 hypothetical protein [Clostridium tepidum]MDU6877416.1 hypothetical protein [Clostridium botulinum]